MNRITFGLVLMLAFAACTVTDDGPAPVTVPQAAPDPRIGELQTSMTELLERLDVMNSRLARLEENGVASAPAPQAVARQTVRESASEAPAAEMTTGAPEPSAQPVQSTVQLVQSTVQPVQSTVQPVQRALVGARLAEDYRQAIMLVGRGKHADARRAFQQVFDADPAGDLADNALFWIGETYYSAGDYTNAVRHYNRVVNEFSDQNKAPDAMFKTALAQARTGDLALARRTLQQVIERYPYSSTASSAKAELQRIRF